jgi:hypothetical protein
MSAVVKLSDRALAAQVDRLGELNGQIAALKKRADECKDRLIESGYAEIEGKKYRASIVLRESVRLDQKIVRGFLSPAEIAAASRVVESVSVCLYDL